MFKLTGIFLLILLISPFNSSYSQRIDSIPNNVIGTTSLPTSLDSSITDQIIPDSLTVLQNDSIKEVINASVFYNAEDSMVLDVRNQKVRLYGNAIIRYEKLELTAEFVEYDFNTNTACASGLPDSLGVLIGKPKLNDDGSQFSQEYLCYNFRSQKGYSKVAVTQEGEAVFHAALSKRQSNEWVHVRNGKFTTCDAENPHYHFHLSRAILIPDDKVVSGPLYMKVRKVPLPLALPFGWFPTKRESTHGIILPGYGDANNLGFFLKDGGYYIPLGRYADTRILADIYSRGSWALKNATNYKKRYRYSGNFSLSRSVIKSGFEELSSYSKDVEFFVRWSHNQDQKAKPNSRFSANVNLGSRNNFRNNLNSSQEEYLSNTFNSSVQWTKSFPGKPINLTVAARHSQNSATGNVDLTLPSVNFNMSRVYLPLSWVRSSPSVKKKWFEQIGLSYSANFENLLSSSNSDLALNRTDQLTREMKNGIKQTASLSTQLKTGFVTITPNFSMNEYWAFKYLTKEYDPESQMTQVDTLSGFRSARDWRMSVSANTQFYGIFNFNSSNKVKAIRHVITPSIGTSYTPYLNRNTFGFFGEDGAYDSYSEFEVARFQPINTNESFNLNMSLGNNLEMKMANKIEGEPDLKVKIIESFTTSGSYNMIADSINLSDISMRGFTTLFKKVNLNVNSTHNAYARNESGQVVDRFLLSEEGRLLRLRRANAALGFTMRSKNESEAGKSENATEQELEYVASNPDAFVDFSVPWNLTLSYSLNLSRNFDAQTQNDTSLVTQSILFNGDFTVFEKWKIGFNSGYDFVAKDFTPTTLNLYWDLHCWEFSFNWIPFGVRQSFSLQLNIKSSLLKDLKLQARGGPNGFLF
jgi:hypothetical protein